MLFLRFLSVLCVVVWLGPQPAHAVTPVAWWSFDNPAALGQDSAGTAHATSQGSPAAGAGVRNGGVQLNGSGDCLRAADSPILELTDRLTVLVWAKAGRLNGNYPLVSPS